MSASRFTRSPTDNEAILVLFSVYGITARVNDEAPLFTTVKLIPSTAIKPFSTI
jgi:hypothetical protein